MDRTGQQKRWEAELDAVEARLDELSAKARVASSEARAGYEKTLEDLRSRREALRRDLRRLGEASQDGRQELERRWQESWTSFKEAVQETAARLSR